MFVNVVAVAAAGGVAVVAVAAIVAIVLAVYKNHRSSNTNCLLRTAAVVEKETVMQLLWLLTACCIAQKRLGVNIKNGCDPQLVYG